MTIQTYNTIQKLQQTYNRTDSTSECGGHAEHFGALAAACMRARDAAFDEYRGIRRVGDLRGVPRVGGSLHASAQARVRRIMALTDAALAFLLAVAHAAERHDVRRFASTLWPRRAGGGEPPTAAARRMRGKRAMFARSCLLGLWPVWAVLLFLRRTCGRRSSAVSHSTRGRCIVGLCSHNRQGLRLQALTRRA